MNPKWLRIIEIVAVACSLWLLFTYLAQIHAGLVWLIILLLATINLALEWLLRFDPKRLLPAYSIRIVKLYVDWLCQMTGLQSPTAFIEHFDGGSILLHSDQDFSVGASRAKQVVMGHDEVLDRILWGIRDAILLKKQRRKASSDSPLAAFLLIGGEGIGKRYLSRVIAKLFYPSGRVTVFECRDSTVQSLFGGHGLEGDVLAAVRSEPAQILFFEGLDMASPDVVRELKKILTTGVYHLNNARAEISFRGTILVFTTTQGADQLEAEIETGVSTFAWHKKAVEILAAAIHVDTIFLNALKEIVPCSQPSAEIQAKVTAILMAKECENHGIELAQVDPKIIASQARRFNAESGFHRLPQEIKKLLSPAILAASQQGHSKLSLQIRAGQALGKN